MVVYNKLSAQVIEKVVTEVQRQQQTVKPVGGEEASPFKQMLDSMGVGQKYATALGFGNEQISVATPEVNAISASNIAIDETALALKKDMPGSMDTVVNMLQEVNHGQMRLEDLTQQLLHSGKNFSLQELLALQAHVYHIAQITELVVKAADQGVSSIKSVLNTNIQ